MATPSNLGTGFVTMIALLIGSKDNPKKIKTLQSMAYDAETRKLKAIGNTERHTKTGT